MNNVHQIVQDLSLLFATNLGWWDYYWNRQDGPKDHPCEKWTNSEDAASKYKLKYISSRDARGLSKSKQGIHHGHSSGFCLLNLAYLNGAERIVLLGYDMKYSPDYDGYNKRIGSSPRHYFGEYPKELSHWPKVHVKQGVHVELIEQYESVARQQLVEIVNCTPDSSVKCFPMKEIYAV